MTLGIPKRKAARDKIIWAKQAAKRKAARARRAIAALSRQQKTESHALGQREILSNFGDIFQIDLCSQSYHGLLEIKEALTPRLMSGQLREEVIADPRRAWDFLTLFQQQLDLKGKDEQLENQGAQCVAWLFSRTHLILYLLFGQGQHGSTSAREIFNYITSPDIFTPQQRLAMLSRNGEALLVTGSNLKFNFAKGRYTQAWQSPPVEISKIYLTR